MVKDLNKEDREKLDAALLARPQVPSEVDGLQPPSWWHGEEDASNLAAAFSGMRRPRR